MKIETTTRRKFASCSVISLQGFFLVIALVFALKPAILKLINLLPCTSFAFWYAKDTACFKMLICIIKFPVGFFHVSPSLIKLMGISGVALQAYTNLSISKLPGIQMHQIFRWHYPLYSVVYMIYLVLVLFCHYSLDIKALNPRFEVCAFYCTLGMFVGFCFSIWSSLMSLLSSHNHFIAQYVHASIKNYNRTVPAFERKYKNLGISMFVASHFPFVLNKQQTLKTCNRDFEEAMKRNQQLWLDLLGSFAAKNYNSQILAIYTVVEELNNFDYKSVEKFYVCGLLLWVYQSTPSDDSFAERWKRIARFIGDMRTVADHKAMVKDGGKKYTDSFEKQLSAVAFCLFHLMKLLTTDLEAYKAVDGLSKDLLCWSNLPESNSDNLKASIECAFWLYNLLVPYLSIDATYITMDNFLPLSQYLETRIDYGENYE